MRKRAQRSHYSAPTISHGEQCSVEGETGLSGKIRQYMVGSYKDMHKDTPTDKVEGVKDVFVFPSTRHRPYPTYIIHRSSFIIRSGNHGAAVAIYRGHVSEVHLSYLYFCFI